MNRCLKEPYGIELSGDDIGSICFFIIYPCRKKNWITKSRKMTLPLANVERTIND